MKEKDGIVSQMKKQFSSSKKTNSQKDDHNKKSSKNLFQSSLFKKEKKEKTKTSDQNQIPAEQEIAELDENTIDVIKARRMQQEKIDGSEWDEIEFYQVKKPFTYVSIIQHIESRDKRYLLIEPFLEKDERKYYDFIHEVLNAVSVDTHELDNKGPEKVLENLVDEIIKDYELTLTPIRKQKMLYFLKKKLLGLDRLEPLMNDPRIEDISCDGSEVPLFLYHRDHGSIQSNIRFPDEEELSSFVIKLSQKCGKHISIANPMIDATMPDGSRIQMTLSTEISTKGSTFTIRKFREEPFSPPDLIRFNTMSSEMIAYFWMAIEHGYNALISGGTASGKTSTLNALALFVPRESKIVSIEETREINLPHPNWIPGVTRSGFGEVVNNRVTGEIDLFDLMKAALRQRPEYILVGEIRGKEAYVLFQAMATGHTTYSTVHADSTQALIHRLEGKPINIPRTMLQSLDIILLMRTQKTANKQQRRCIKIVELLSVDSETNEVLTNTVFEWNPVEGKFDYSGKSFILEQIHELMDMNIEEMTEEINHRSEIIEWMRKYNIREFTDVGHILAKYAETPKDILELIKNPPEKMDEVVKEELLSDHEDISSILDLPKNNYQSLSDKMESKKDSSHKFHSLFSSKRKKSSKKKDDEGPKKSILLKPKKPKKNRKVKKTSTKKDDSTKKTKKSSSFFSKQRKTDKVMKKKLNDIAHFTDSDNKTSKEKTEKKKVSVKKHKKRDRKQKEKEKSGLKIPKIKIKINKDNKKKQKNPHGDQ